jgi:hypothetical protein
MRSGADRPFSASLPVEVEGKAEEIEEPEAIADLE